MKRLNMSLNSGRKSTDIVASFQTRDDPNAVTASASLVPTNRSVGISGKMKAVKWATSPEKSLYDMRLEKTALRLARTPGAMRATKIWTARADVCDLPGDEILMQIRSPLTCGSLGCELLVLSDAGGAPRVVLQAIGDTIDSPARDKIVINQGVRRERTFDYVGDSFRQSRK